MTTKTKKVMYLKNRINKINTNFNKNQKFILKNMAVDLVLKPTGKSLKLRLENKVKDTFESSYAVYKNQIVYLYMSSQLNLDIAGIQSNGFLLYDADNNYTTSSLPNLSVGFSFECMSQLYYNLTSDDVKHNFLDGNFVVLDVTCDDTKYYYNIETKEEVLKKYPLPLGYSILGSSNFYYYHRSGSVLVYDKTNNTYFIFGQDEGSYFGCELPSKATTVDEAYKLLMPEEAYGKEFIRQGEWFFVKTKEPKMEEIKFYQSTNIVDTKRNGRIDSYPFLENNQSAKHYMTYKFLYVLNDGTLVFENPTMVHENGDHADVNLTGFYSLHKNRAVQSVSQEGVD